VSDRLLIKHAIGSRTFLDSAEGPLQFLQDRSKDGFVFTVFVEKNAGIEEILRLERELNLFIFHEENGVAAEKTWYYIGDGLVEYSADLQALIVHARSQITYNPAEFTQ
jgi:hypothetical protein